MNADPSKINVLDFEGIVSGKNNFMGVRIESEFLILVHKKQYTFRAKLENLVNLKDLSLLKLKHGVFSNVNLKQYFSENMDNPYALYHVMNQRSFHINETITHLNQFPPLFPKKDKLIQEQGIKRIYEKMQLADLLFTYRRNSGISQLIRKYNMSHWSHVEYVDDKKQLVGMSTDGIDVSDIFTLNDPNIDIGLYRFKFNDGDGENFKKRVKIYLKTSKKRKINYNWLLLLKIFLRDRWRIPFLKFKPTELSARGLINHFALELIDYV